MTGVLALDAVVPGEERQAQVGDARLLDPEQAVLDLLPEAGRGPVLDREAGALGDHRVLAAVDALELVAEEQRAGPAVATLAQVGIAQGDRLDDGEAPPGLGSAVTV